MEAKEIVRSMIVIILGIIIAFVIVQEYFCKEYPDFCLYGYAVLILFIIGGIFGFYKIASSKS